MHARLLTNAGFVPCRFPSLGAFALLLQRKLFEFPAARQRIGGTRGITDFDTVYIEVVPGGSVQLGVEAVGYYEEPLSVDSPEGQALLRDAGVAV